MGCGEILVKSIDRDGTRAGLDYNLINILKENTKKPFIYCGGLKDEKDLKIFKKKFPKEAIAISSALHFNLINSIK